MEKNFSKEEKKALSAFGKTVISLSSQTQKSLERVAYEAGISKSYIYDIANGKANPSLVIMHRLASSLDIPVWKLIQSSEKS